MITIFNSGYTTAVIFRFNQIINSFNEKVLVNTILDKLR